jgi:hypothetical protein
MAMMSPTARVIESNSHIQVRKIRYECRILLVGTGRAMNAEVCSGLS